MNTENMRLWFISALLASVTLTSGIAQAASVSCPYYGGHIDIEGKIGSKRDIGEISLFLPMSCSPDSLIFADMRLKRDNTDNKEGNWGLGLRQMYEKGIWGNYVYLDRKISGVTDKYHTQLTFGSEWLAENWEVRANAYVPLTGSKSADISSGGISGVNLSGNTIVVEESAGLQLTEKSLYGGDLEAGFKMPDTRFWLHAGVFSFHGEDVSSVNGGRVRARYDLTDTVSLNAEAQYDGVRGRQGWVGVRFTIPFGGPEKRPEGLTARMTASPVRDVDIVTQSKKEKVGEDRSLTVLNNDTGMAQNVLYVDNSFTGIEQGTKEAPFSTLAAAQAQLNDNDIVYIAHGNGSTTGMDSGFQINRDNVMLIGSGSDLVYDPTRFSLGGSSSSADSIVLIPKTQAPTITHTAQWAPVLAVTGRDTTISGINVTGAYDAAGINAIANNVNLGTLTIRDVNSSNNGGFGVNAYATGGTGRFDRVVLDHVTTNANNHNGTRVSAEHGTIGSILITNHEASHNLGPNGAGLNIVSFDNAHIEEAHIKGLTTNNNATLGFTIGTLGNSDTALISMMTVEDLIATGNAQNGVYVGSGGPYGDIGYFMLKDSVVTQNGSNGIHFQTYNGGTAYNLLRNTAVTQNQQHGVWLYKDGGDTHVIDLGNASEDGMNTFSGNGVGNPSMYGDLTNDLWGSTGSVQARGNWWGSSSGPSASQIKGSMPVDTDPHLTEVP